MGRNQDRPDIPPQIDASRRMFGTILLCVCVCICVCVCVRVNTWGGKESGS